MGRSKFEYNREENTRIVEERKRATRRRLVGGILTFAWKLFDELSRTPLVDQEKIDIVGNAVSIFSTMYHVVNVSYNYDY